MLLGWHFLAGNIVLGLLMVAYAYAITRVFVLQRIAEDARRHAKERLNAEGQEHESGDGMPWRHALASREEWSAIAESFFTEWKMVWKELLFGFAVAGFISTLVPRTFWDSLLLGGGDAPTFLVVLENALVAPVIAFFTFIGSMGNVPLAAMLWSKGASFGGVMSFLGADLVSATVVWIHAKYYGWKFTLYVSAVLYASMAAAGVTVHYLFAFTNQLPSVRKPIAEMVAFNIDYTFWLNVAFVTLAAALLFVHWRWRSRPEPVTAQA